MATNSTGSDTVGFYICDAIFGCRMLVDTGALHMAFPSSEEDRNRTSNTTATLVAANGSPICCYRTRTLKISTLGRTYDWPFIIVDIKVPLLGADFLAHHGLLVDVGRKSLLDTGICRSRPIAPRPGIPVLCSLVSHKYNVLQREFPDVFKLELCHVAGTPAKHGIYHHISTMGPPTYAKFCRLPPKRLQDAKHAFANMEQMGICRKVSNPWTSPLYTVKKSDGNRRPCGDYRHLNLVTTPDHYPLPNMRTFMGPSSSRRWTYSSPTSKFLYTPTTFPKQLSSHRSGRTRSLTSLLASGMPGLPSNV
ncbi:uncharacterized protein LOC135210412 [Macrobrachium nipponense]|uniref:uncharacterized protein LOC135210412 n=1 Tax=Macrobrachium nipponense TaxID=159736 RepID=UPI0030C7F33B